MKELDALLQLIQNDPSITRFKTIEAIIEKDTALFKEYQALLKIQKQMVQQQVTKSSKLNTTKVKYEGILRRLEAHPLFNEYLTLQDEINQDLQLIQKMIEDGLDFNYLE